MKKYLVAGLLVWLPLAITVWVLSWLLGLLDGLFGWLLGLSKAVLPLSTHGAIEALAGIPGLGVIVMVLGLMLTGIAVANVIGQWWVHQWHRVMHQIPIVKSIYSSVKQVSDTLFSTSGNAFREAVLVQYPRPGAWTIAFVTGRPGGEVATHLPGDYVSVYVPTTPNPTSGYLEIVPVDKLTPTDWSVDEAMAFIISGGAVSPETMPFDRPAPARD